jgi:ribokinase/sulfofructose kinase
VQLPLQLAPVQRRTDLLAVGENSLDLIAVVSGHPAPNQKAPIADYAELPGGEAASAAVGVARLGWRAAYIGRFGDDRLGEISRRAVTAEGVDTSGAIVVDGTPNRMAIILVDRKTGDRTVLWRRDPRLALRAKDVPDDRLRDARVLLVGSEDARATAGIARRARDFGVRVVGDLDHVGPHTPELLRHLDIAVMSAAFPQAFTGESDPVAALHRVAGMTPAALVCVTEGASGCLGLVDGRAVRVPAFRVAAVDTTGAGDMFRAGLIARWLDDPGGPDVFELLRYANAVAALNCRAPGAQTAAPTRAQVDALLQS